MKKLLIATLALVMAVSLSLVPAVVAGDGPLQYSTTIGRIGYGGDYFDFTDGTHVTWEPLTLEIDCADGIEFIITLPVAFEAGIWVNDNFALVFDDDNDGAPDFQVLYNTLEQGDPAVAHWATKTCIAGSWSGYEPIPEGWEVSASGDLGVFTINMPADSLDCPCRFALQVHKYVPPEQLGGEPVTDPGAPWSTAWFVLIQLPQDSIGNWISSENYQELSLPCSQVLLETEVLNPIICIDVSPTSIDFGSLHAGETSATEVLTIENLGTVDVKVTASTDSAFYDAALYLGGYNPISGWSKNIVKGTSSNVGAKVVVPDDWTAGTETGTLIFWAELPLP